MVGSLACELHSERGLAAAWFSEDGIDWEAALMPAVESDDGKFTTLLVAGGGLLAHTQPVDPPIGAGPTGRWWLSTDARTWRPAEDDGIDVPAGGFALGDGEHIVVLATDAGWSPMIGDPYPGLTRAWLSSDGASWAELAVSGTMPERSVQGIWLGQNGVIAIGAEQSWFAAADVP